jgi:molybdate transport system substrate-binding protein
MKSHLVGIFVAAGLMTGAVQAAEVKVFAAAALSGPFKELMPQYERASGNKVTVEYASSPQTTKKVESGEPFDMVVTTFAEEVLKDPARNGHFQTSPRPLLASSGLGAAVRAGLPKPDIGSADAFKQALIQAKSVALLPESLNGKHFLGVFQKLGIADEMHAKLKAQKATNEVAEAVAKGEADMGLHVANLLVGIPGVDYVGPVPAEFQQTLTFTAAVGVKAKEPAAAEALIKYLSTADAAAVMRKYGLQTP